MFIDKIYLFELEFKTREPIGKTCWFTSLQNTSNFN